MPIPIKTHKWSTQKNKDCIDFYVDILSDDDRKSLEEIVGDNEDVCQICQSSSGKPGVKLYIVPTNTDFKDAVKALAKIFKIKEYVKNEMNQLRALGGRMISGTSKDNLIILFMEIFKCL